MASTKRKDSKGRVLKDGESQRTDGRYQYRYQGLDGKRHCVYGQTLNELREREAEIQKDLTDGINRLAGKITVYMLVQRYVSRKSGLAEGSMEILRSFLNLLKNDPFGQREIGSVRIGDAKDWLIQQYNNGKKFTTVQRYKAVLQPAFEDALEDYEIRKNPFHFDLGKIMVNDSEKRTALTTEQQERWMIFIYNDPHYKQYFDIFQILFETGLRIGEFCGLTLRDLDFEEKRIRVERQIWQDKHGKLHVKQPKTGAGIRFVPMSTLAEESFHRMIANRKPRREMIFDGVSLFLFCKDDGGPKPTRTITAMCQRALAKFRAEYPTEPLFELSPHICRHTFASRMAASGMSISALQYTLGHSKVEMTLSVYTHSGFEDAKRQMSELDNRSRNLTLAK